MISYLYNFWQLLRGNLWFVPAIFCLCSFGFITAFYFIEQEYLQSWDISDYLFQGSTDDAKAITVTLLSAMITMATLAISITIVVLSLAASQLGPRLIKSFMSDRKTKDFIGLFFATVIACFVLTIILHSRTSEAITPQITISLVFVMCFINLFVLLGFVHHVAKSCIADNVILRVSHDLKDALNRLTKDVQSTPNDKETTRKNWPSDFDHVSTHIFFERSGYVQHINYEKMADYCAEHNLYVRITFKPGRFLVSGEDGVHVYSKSKKSEKLKEKIRHYFIIGENRTPTQDLEYSVRHLVEIAIRALSPGINDSFTAMTVVDHLASAIAILFEKETAATHFYDDDGQLRIQATQSDDAAIVFTAFDQILHSSEGMPSMMRHLLKRFTVLVKLAPDQNAKKALLLQLRGIEHCLKNMTCYVSDEKELNKQTKSLIQKLN